MRPEWVRSPSDLKDNHRERTTEALRTLYGPITEAPRPDYGGTTVRLRRLYGRSVVDPNTSPDCRQIPVSHWCPWSPARSPRVRASPFAHLLAGTCPELSTQGSSFASSAAGACQVIS